MEEDVSGSGSVMMIGDEDDEDEDDVEVIERRETSRASRYIFHNLAEIAEEKDLRELIETVSSDEDQINKVFMDDEDDNNCTPIHVAILARNMETTKFLFNFANDVYKPEDIKGRGFKKCNGSPILHLIASVGALSENKEFSLFALKCFFSLKDHILHAELFENSLDEYGRTIFHLCAYYDLPDFAEIVLGKLDEISSQLALLPSPTASGRQIFMERKRQEASSVINIESDENGNKNEKTILSDSDLEALWVDLDQIQKSLYESRAQAISIAHQAKISKPPALLVTKDKLTEATPLHVAAENGFISIITLYCKTGASIDIIDVKKRTPLHIAAMKKETEALNILKGFAKNIQFEADNNQMTIEQYIAWNDQGLKNNKINGGKTLLLSHDLCSKHYTCNPYHTLTRGGNRPPENVNRLHVLLDHGVGTLRSKKLENDVEWGTATPAKISDVLKVHDWSYVQRIRNICERLPKEESLARLDGDTTISKESYNAAMLAAGSLCDAIDNVIKGTYKNAFCAVRPPGHHAGPRGVVICEDDPHGSHGFCLLSNAAIGAAYALDVYRHQGIGKVAIVDFDVHHGNGTEACVKNVIPSNHTTQLDADGIKISMQTPSYKPWLDDNDSERILFISSHGYGAG